MKVLIDTNIIIDILEKRMPFFPDSYKIIQLGLNRELETFMSAGAVTDVYYIINRSINNANTAREKIFVLTSLLNICSTTPEDIDSALLLNVTDFEDSVIASIAKHEKADYIITRNENDFANSPVPAISPARFLKKYFR